MTGTANINDIIMPDNPLSVDFGKWILEHPECDAIIEQIGTGPIMLVYAYSISKGANRELRRIRDERFKDKEILKGVTMDGIRNLV